MSDIAQSLRALAEKTTKNETPRSGDSSERGMSDTRSLVTSLYFGASPSRLTLSPEQQMNVDSIADSLTLQCGKDASSIMLIPPVVGAGLGTAK